MSIRVYVYLSSTINCLLTMSLKCWFISLSVYLHFRLSDCLPAGLSFRCLCTLLSVLCLSTLLSVRSLCTLLSVCLSNSLVTHLSPCLAAWLPIFICVSTVSLPACSPIYLLPAYPSVCLYLQTRNA